MKKLTATLVLLPLLALAACKSDDSDLDAVIAETKGEPIEITLPQEPLAEQPDQAPDSSDPAYNDYVESFQPKAEVTVRFDGDTAEVSGSSSRVAISVSGAHVKATLKGAGVKLILAGASANCSLTVSGDQRFQIELDNAALTNPSGAVINNQCSKTLYLVSRPGTSNTLCSTGGDALLSDAKGCLFSEGQVSLSGSGQLRIESAFRNALATDDYLLVRPQVRLDIACSSGNGIKANDGVTVKGGSLNISVSQNGAKGINCEDFVAILGGRTTILSSGASRLESVEVSEEYPDGVNVVGSAGVKADTSVAVHGGELSIKCTGADAKGIKASADYLQTGGTVRIVTLGAKELSTPRCIKADGALEISGGYLYAYSRHCSPLNSDGPMTVYNYLQRKTYLIEIFH